MAVTAADLQVKFSTSGSDKVTGDLNKVNRGIGGLVKNAAAVGVGVLGANMFGMIARGFAGGVSGAIDFGKQMANVNSIAQVSDAQLASMSDQVLRMATDPRIAAAPATLAAGLYEINSSGFAGADAMNILEKAAIAGTAGLTSTDTAARAITATLNAYGLEADQAGRVSDVLFKTVDSGVITFDQLANNLGNVLPIANSLGVSIEEVGAAYAQMTLSGVSASQAETQIASLMRSALNPTQQLTDAVQSHGYASAAAAIEQEGLAGFLDIVNEAAGGNQETMMDLLGTQEAMNAATILGKNNTDDYRKAIDEMNAASADGGATQKALEKQMQSASFQLQKAKQAAQIFVTRGIGLISPAIGAMARGFTTLMTRGLIPFTDLVARALGGSFRFKEVLGDIPQPLRRFAQGLGTVLEGVGDLAEFMLQGDWNRVAQRLPGELQQIVGGLRAMGEELAQGARFVANIVVDLVTSFAGVIWDNRGRIAAWIGEQLGNLAGALIDVGSATVSGILSLGGDLADAAGNLWGWIAGKIMGGRAAGREFSRGQIGAAVAPIDVGTVLITGLLALGEGLIDAGQWLVDELRPQVDPVTIADVTPRIILGTPEITYFGGFDLGRYTADKIIERLTNIDVPEVTWWKLVIGIPLAVGFAVAFGPMYVINKIVEKLTGVNIPNFTDWSMTVALGALGFIAGFLGEIQNRILKELTGVELKDFSDWTMNVGIPATFNLLFGVIDIVTAIIGKIVNITVSLTDITKFNLDIPDLSVPSAGELFDAITAKLPTITIDPNDFIDWLPISFGGSEEGAAMVRAQQVTSEFLPEFGTGTPTGGRPTPWAGLMTPATIPAPDTSAFDSGIGAALDNARKLNTETFQAILTADISPFGAVVQQAWTSGGLFAGETFRTTLDADIGPFGAVMQQAWTAGGLFAAETFRATLDANAGPALGAIGQAIGAASAFARTWTATLTVDTSGAIAAAQAAVQFISDLLPNSPAKRGPLARMPSFTYLGDALLAEAGRMNRVFTGALTPPGDVAFAGAGGGGAGRPAHVTYQTINMGRTDFRHGYDWERFVKEKQRQAAIGSARA